MGEGVVPWGSLRGGARGGHDRPLLPGALFGWPTIGSRGLRPRRPQTRHGVAGALWGSVTTLRRRAPRSARALRRPGRGRSLLRAVSLAGPPNRLPESAGRVRTGSFMGLRAEQARATSLLEAGRGVLRTCLLPILRSSLLAYRVYGETMSREVDEAEPGPSR